MPRPTIKKDLINLANEQYKKLQELIASMSEQKRLENFTFDITNEKEAHWKRDKNIRDVLIHLYEWQQLLLNWIKSNQNGQLKSFLPEPYNWKTYGEMNIEFWKKHQDTSYDKAIKMVDEGHKKIMTLIENYSNEELFTKGIFKWTGGTTLGSYFISTTSSHYDWAIKKLKKHIK